PGEPVVRREVLRAAPGAVERGDDAEPAAEVGGGAHGGLGDADHRAAGQLARGVEAGVAEAGDHVAVGGPLLLRPGDLGEQAGHGERLVVVALDRGRAHRRRHRPDRGAGAGGGRRAGLDGGGHRRGGVGVDDEDACRGHVRNLVRRARRWGRRTESPHLESSGVRVLICAVGSRGDVVPFTGVGTALRQAGHTVTIAAHPSYAPLVTGAGLRAHPMPGDLGVLLDLPERSTPAYQAGRVPRLTELLYGAARATLEAAADADLLLVNGSAPFGYDIAEALGIPSAGLFSQPMT